MVIISPFIDKYQADIDLFMSAIEEEFAEPISTSDPNAKKIAEMALWTTDKYWVALADGKAIATLGMTKIANNSIALKRIFVNSDFRKKGIAKSLLDTLFTWAAENSCTTIYLGTMKQFKAAQKFYEKKGFTKIEKGSLPLDFPLNKVDTIFYKKTLQ